MPKFDIQLEPGESTAIQRVQHENGIMTVTWDGENTSQHVLSTAEFVSAVLHPATHEKNLYKPSHFGSWGRTMNRVKAMYPSIHNQLDRVRKMTRAEREALRQALDAYEGR